MSGAYQEAHLWRRFTAEPVMDDPGQQSSRAAEQHSAVLISAAYLGMPPPSTNDPLGSPWVNMHDEQEQHKEVVHLWAHIPFDGKLHQTWRKLEVKARNSKVVSVSDPNFGSSAEKVANLRVQLVQRNYWPSGQAAQNLQCSQAAASNQPGAGNIPMTHILLHVFPNTL